jgi:Tfp pilus assembly protein PilE
MNRLKKMRSAITLIELVFVIVILGIVSSIGAAIIADTYESYIVQRAQYRATEKTELTLNQIANRLRYAIPGTVMAENNGALVPLTEITATNSNRLQWVAYDGDSFEAITSASRNPGWSGFCDIDNSTSTTISTPGSNLSLANTIIGNLGGTLNNNARIYFPDGTNYVITGTDNAETISTNIPTSVGNRLYERYKLAWSSYALSIEDGDLYLYYNFSPIAGTALGNNKSLLLKNITNFRFKGSEGSLRIKICKEEQIGMNSSDAIHACKEKVIF